MKDPIYQCTEYGVTIIVIVIRSDPPNSGTSGTSQCEHRGYHWRSCGCSIAINTMVVIASIAHVLRRKRSISI